MERHHQPGGDQFEIERACLIRNRHPLAREATVEQSHGVGGQVERFQHGDLLAGRILPDSGDSGHVSRKIRRDGPTFDLKLLYIADREWLAETGESATGDRACAMKYGLAACGFLAAMRLSCGVC
jgi:hypothetical protein